MWYSFAGSRGRVTLSVLMGFPRVTVAPPRAFIALSERCEDAQDEVPRSLTRLESAFKTRAEVDAHRIPRAEALPQAKDATKLAANAPHASHCF
jgi:hypothetical protein